MLSCATAASATTVGYGDSFPPVINVVADPGQTNTIVWTADPTYLALGPAVLITDATAPVRVGGRWPASCKKTLRVVRCDTEEIGNIYLGDGPDSFTAPVSTDHGYYSTCCWTPQFTVFGGAGSDRIVASLVHSANIDGGPGNDLIVQGPSRVVHGGAGNDTIVLLRAPNGPFGSYVLDCGDGTDTIAMPESTPTPPDCERRISLPQALADLPPLSVP